MGRDEGCKDSVVWDGGESDGVVGSGDLPFSLSVAGGWGRDGVVGGGLHSLGQGGDGETGVNPGRQEGGWGRADLTRDGAFVRLKGGVGRRGLGQGRVF